MPSVCQTATPRPTVGHHFGSLLQCPQRAWLDYFGDPAAKLRPPSFLLKYQKEGIQHEAEMCRRLYPQAVRIPDRDAPEQRMAMTLAALHSGVPAILQAYLRDGDGLGVADVLERVEGGDLATYRVGEFKRANTLQTEHILQVSWYRELLTRMVGTAADDAFFILGDGTRRQEDLADINPVYESCKVRLHGLQRVEAQPRPHLCRSCPTCPWRGVCVPELVQEEHVSLLPGLGRSHAKRLRNRGISTWQEVASASDEALVDAGLEGADLKRVRTAVKNLSSGKPVTRFNIKPSLLIGITAVAFDYQDQEPHDGADAPTGIWYETSNGVQHVPLADLDAAALSQNMSALLAAAPLAVYGARDVTTLLQLTQMVDADPPECVDVVKVVEHLLHAPLIGLDLAHVGEHLGLPHASSPVERVGVLRNVVDWLASSAPGAGAA